jgi:hypothetical protein
MVRVFEGLARLEGGGMCPGGIFFLVALEPAGLNNSTQKVKGRSEGEWRKEKKAK